MEKYNKIIVGEYRFQFFCGIMKKLLEYYERKEMLGGFYGVSCGENRK